MEAAKEKAAAEIAGLREKLHRYITNPGDPAVLQTLQALLSSGVECVNDIRALFGQSLINEPWAWEHFMTKNYTAIAELLAAMAEGG